MSHDAPDHKTLAHYQPTTLKEVEEGRAKRLKKVQLHPLMANSKNEPTFALTAEDQATLDAFERVSYFTKEFFKTAKFGQRHLTMAMKMLREPGRVERLFATIERNLSVQFDEPMKPAKVPSKQAVLSAVARIQHFTICLEECLEARLEDHRLDLNAVHDAAVYVRQGLFTLGDTPPFHHFNTEEQDKAKATVLAAKDVLARADVLLTNDRTETTNDDDNRDNPPR